MTKSIDRSVLGGNDDFDKAWDFKTRDAFAAFAQATLVEWTRRLPESQWQAFIADVLDRYQLVAADSPSELTTFKFYQLEAAPTPAPGPSDV